MQVLVAAAEHATEGRSEPGYKQGYRPFSVGLELPPFMVPS